MSTADFLLELRSEEIPARMQAGARADLEKLFRREMEAAGLAVGALTVWSTPRRLTLIARGVPLATEAVREETKGPRTSAPEQALEGFLRKTGLTKDQLTERDGVWFAVVEKPGRAAADVLADAIPAIIRAFPWPKSQRWGAASLQPDSLRWVRPLSGIIALLGGEVVPCEIGGIHSGRTTMGHRFHHSGEIVIDGVDDYAAKLRDAHVIVDHAEREAIVREGARKAAADAGLVLVEDEGLVIENAGLTEWPKPLLGRFDEAFLEVPPEVIQLTARVNQKYFICRDAAGKLANAFVCTANIEAKGGGAMIVAGNRKVLAARLSDARFFWEQDRKTPLLVHAEKLNRIVFHEKLGTVFDRCLRIGANLNALISSAERNDKKLASTSAIAIAAKADLVTEMVGEFPELQGLMGGYYALNDKLGSRVATAIAEHYRPLGPNDPIPSTSLGCALAIADKIDTIVAFFAIQQRPSGSRDPFGLRRSAVGLCRIILETNQRLSLRHHIDIAVRTLISANIEYVLRYIDANYKTVEGVNTELELDGETGQIRFKGLNVDLPNEIKAPMELLSRLRPEAAHANLVNEVFSFVIDRLKVQQRDAGVRHDLIDAVFALGGEDDLVRLLARVHALQAFVGTEDGVNLLAGYKRAANILKKEEYTPLAAEYELEPAEQALAIALDKVASEARGAEHYDDFDFAMRVLATLRAPIDAFFESVTVNDADPAKRAGRLGLLDRFRAAVHKVADFSRIEG